MRSHVGRSEYDRLSKVDSRGRTCTRWRVTGAVIALMGDGVVLRGDVS